MTTTRAAETVGQPVALKEGNGDAVAETVESVGSEDALEELPERTRRRRGRPYKIQEVIRRRQIILVQVVKEERGNKGAALTTYLSLAGRYTVLMPNTARGGGISRKITQPTDRKRLREIAGELEVPEGMGLIIRTAGAQRTKTEIKRDYDYLLRLWENVRDLTLKSTAPALVYEEGSLIKRSIRDLYNKDIDEVLVAGDDAYREAKDFMRMLMPSHAKNVKPYKEPEPIFIRYQVERQLAAMFSPQVVLKSGGYIVINQTEALVAIDVNSGKATREHNIEDTALKTNLEASEEIARQLRLRDLAGLIVIDFIDMDERRNNRLVERRLKESLAPRPRAHPGRAHQPFRPAGNVAPAPADRACSKARPSPARCARAPASCGRIESVALDILRSIEDRLITDGVVPLVATTAVEVALYILNQKRAHLKDIERATASPSRSPPTRTCISRNSSSSAAPKATIVDGESTVVHMDWAHHRESPAPPLKPPCTRRQPRLARPRAKASREAAADGAGAASATPRAAPRDIGPHLAESDGHEAHEAEDEEFASEGIAEEARGAEARGAEGRLRRRGAAQGTAPQRPPWRTPRPTGSAAGSRRRARPELRESRVRSAPSEAGARERSRHEASSQVAPAERRGALQWRGARGRSRAARRFSRASAQSARREPEPSFSRADGERGAASAASGEHPKTEAEQSSEPPRRGWWRR